MRYCRLCGFPISKDLEELSRGGILEEFEDGYCFDCFILLSEV